MLNLTGNGSLLAGASDHYGNPRKGEYLGKTGIPRRLIWGIIDKSIFCGLTGSRFKTHMF